MSNQDLSYLDILDIPSIKERHMSELAINQIITIANAEMQSTRDHLEVEESGRRHTIVITHSPEVQEAIGQKIEMRRTE